MSSSSSVLSSRRKSPLSTPGCYNCYEFMGAHPTEEKGITGWKFRVWAPAAKAVSVVGSFNDWRTEAHPMKRSAGGIWSLFIPGLKQYDVYQYAIQTKQGELLYKFDPYAFHSETRPSTASKLYDLEGYQWGDDNWIAYRSRIAWQSAPLNLYEVHLGSWRRTGDGQVLNYRDIAHYLVPYVKEMGYTGVLLLPIGEHPLDESLGYQLTGYFAVTSRFGTPADFMYLVDQLHQAGVSVMIHSASISFPDDRFALHAFDGTPCYGIPVRVKRGRSRKGISSLREICEFNTSKTEVQNFLISSAFFWMKKFHLDGMFYTGISSKNADFIQRLNEAIHEAFPYAITCAIQPQPSSDFTYIWYHEWVENMLSRITDPRRTDSIFAVAERPSPNSILPLSHDLVACPKPSLAARMQGDDYWKFAQVRAFYLFFLTQPGSKLTMMGAEFGQWDGWNCLQSLDWHLLQYQFYQKQQRFFREANALYLSTPAFWAHNSDSSFQVIKTGKDDQIAAYTRQGSDGSKYCIAVSFSNAGIDRYWLELPHAGSYQVIFSTDDCSYGGQGKGTQDELIVQAGSHDTYGLWLTLPPMSAVVLQQSSSAGK